MTIPARYSGVCPECYQYWQPGDLIRSTEAAASGLPRWTHAVCPDPTIDGLIGTACPVCWLVHPNVPGACDKE